MGAFGRMPKRRLIIWILLTLAALVALGGFYILSYGQALRLEGIRTARITLAQAYIDFTRSGTVGAYGTSKPFVFTNTVVADRTSYYCTVAVGVPGFEDEGVLAMTTNETFIWLDKTRPPKIIPTTGYKPQLFPERF